MADGRIIIDTRIRKDNAKKDLNELRKDAQATASEISKIDQKIHEAQGDTKLADDLKNAQAAAAATEKELEMIDAALIKMKRSGQGNTESFLSMQQAGEGLREKYNAQLAAQSKAQAAYDRQQASIAGMTAARGILAGQLAETQKFEQQASAIQRAKVAVTSFENSLRKAGGAFGSLIKRAKTFMSHMIKAPKLMGNFGSRMREIAFGALLFNGISAALRNFTTGLQNALRQSGAFVTTMSNLKGAALNATAPLVSALTPALTALANAAAVALSYLSKLFAFFTGKSISGLKATAKAMGGAASSAKELKNNMLGIDELNVVDSGASGGGGGGLGNIEPNYGFEGQNDFLDTLMAAIESGDWAGAGILLADKVNSMVESVDAYSWGQKLGTILQNGIVFGYSFLTTFDWNGLGAKLAGFVNGLLDKVDGAQLGALFAAKFTIAIRTLGTFLANLDWATLCAKCFFMPRRGLHHRRNTRLTNTSSLFLRFMATASVQRMPRLWRVSALNKQKMRKMVPRQPPCGTRNHETVLGGYMTHLKENTLIHASQPLEKGASWRKRQTRTSTIFLGTLWSRKGVFNYGYKMGIS